MDCQSGSLMKSSAQIVFGNIELFCKHVKGNVLGIGIVQILDNSLDWAVGIICRGKTGGIVDQI